MFGIVLFVYPGDCLLPQNVTSGFIKVAVFLYCWEATKTIMS